MPTLQLTFKHPAPSRKRDLVVTSADIGNTTLNELRKYWEVEQVFNAVPGIRVHIEVKE